MPLGRNLGLLILGIAVACRFTDASEQSPDISNYATPTNVQPMSATTVITVQGMLLNYIRQRQVAAPGGVMCDTCLFKGWRHRHGTRSTRRFAIGNLQSAMADYPAQVQEKLRVLLYTSSGSTSFESFAVNIQQTHAEKRSYIGFARRLDNIVDVALVSAEIGANLVPKYTTIERRVCRKILWIKKCKTVRHTEQRGYYANEISGMTAMLMSETFRVFAEQAAALN